LEPLKRLTAHLDGPRLWVKREDCTGVGFGGNKLRKLDFVLREAMDAGADTLVSGGVVQSNSQRQVAARRGQARSRLSSRRLSRPSRGADSRLRNLRQCAPQPALRREAASRRLDRGAQSRHSRAGGEAVGGRAPAYVVPYGVSSPLGAIGYATAIAESPIMRRRSGFPARERSCTAREVRELRPALS